MNLKRSTILASALAAAAAAVPAGAAEAKVYCVHQITYSCAAGSVDTGSSLQYALNLAAADTEADTIKISAGTFTGPNNGWDAVNDNPVTVTGSKGTVLDGTGQTIGNPAFKARSATLERFKLLAPALGLFQKGITTRAGVIRDLTVVNPGKQGQGIVSEGSSVLRVTVDMTGDYADAIVVAPAFVSTAITRSNLTANGTGIVVNKGNAYVTRTRMSGAGVNAYGGPLSITNSVIKLGDSGKAGVMATCAEGVAMTTVTADHLTVLGGPSTSGAAAQCYANGKAKTTVKNSILATGYSLSRGENAGQTDVVAYGNLLNAGATMSRDNGPLHAGKITQTGNLQGTPTFVPGTVKLPAGSFLIDKAVASSSDYDVYYKPRHVDGDGDGVAQGDIGAAERQPAS